MDSSDLQGPWSAGFSFAWAPTSRHPTYGVYKTSVFYGGRWYDEDHPVVISATGVTVSSVAVANPQIGPDTLAFANQADATRAAKPQSGQLTFQGTTCNGWCQFPGEGPIDWRGDLQAPPAPAPHPTYGVYKTSVFYGGRWYDEDHPVEIRATGVTVSGLAVVNPQISPDTLAFANQADATRAAKPQSGQLTFQGTTCNGWCQFPGEGPINWRGDLIAG